LKKYLLAQKIYYLPNELETYENAARMYYDLRRKSITIRSTIDIFIAQTAIYYDLFLLHKDRDFDFIAQNTPELKILEEL
jgi:predicted nucleic acid-binding protein